MSDAEVITMGCRLNLAESSALQQQLGDNAGDLIIVNSCAVTNEAVRQTRQAIRRAKKRRPTARIIVTGCAAQVDPESFAAMPEVSTVLGNAEKQRPDLFLEKSRNADILVSDIMTIEETAPHLVTAFSGKTRAFVEIQNGCDHRCTFCIIPYGRGNSRSVPAGSVIEHVKKLVGQGFQEVVLTGVDVTSYGHDLPGKPNLGQLVERIIRHVPDLPRLRLSSIDGVEIDERLFDLLTSEKRIMPHVHLSLQSGDDLILKRMKRRHNRALAVDLVARMQAMRPEIAIGADIIAGFPTEDEAMFENSLKLIDDCHIVHGHIFPYSPKTGTPAAKMPQVDGAEIKRRAALLRGKVDSKNSEWLNGLIGSIQNIAVETGGMGGHAENFAYAQLDQQADEGAIIATHIKGVENGKLQAEIIA
ncbi:tRNA (N(6)-L-threonylcarbamoyladenosine(37)-C(2))-methylthiotransferase MtaB [Sphingorhabdus arenilitoris]|uniref:tRNA (N(6)-L-threonylcarbamoyladenosine(37)-C(2))-methylthiotransferase MtaB n=1 Tax=Sphingorhabdus arenilitoris TaxID=1490041 RepID=A0ABV8RF52_9SPHN